MYYKALAAIADTRLAKRETNASLSLGRELFATGDVERAYRYLMAANMDASEYDMSIRKMNINDILPGVEKARYALLDARRRELTVSIILIAVGVAALTLVFIFLIRRQTRKRDALDRLRLAQEEALESLRKANSVKDEHIRQSISEKAEFIRRIDALATVVSRSVMVNKYDKLPKALEHGDIRQNIKNMHEEFDSTFLKLFPAYPQEWAKLFAADEPLAAQPDPGRLSPEMRIFALIRIGVTDIKDIAMFMGYSVNTVNTYKTKVKNRSILPNDRFEEAIMQIG